MKLIECPSTKDQLLSARCPSMLPTWGHFKLILQLKFPRPGRCINFKSYTCVREDCVLTSHGLGLDRHFSSLQIGRLFFFFSILFFHLVCIPLWVSLLWRILYSSSPSFEGTTPGLVSPIMALKPSLKVTGIDRLSKAAELQWQFTTLNPSPCVYTHVCDEDFPNLHESFTMYLKVYLVYFI